MSPAGGDDQSGDRSPESRRKFEAAERALAELQGKDPKLVRRGRLAREREEKDYAERARRMEGRKDELDQERSMKRRELGTRVGIAVAVTALLAMVGLGLVSRWRSRESAQKFVDSLAAPLTARGFSLT